MDTVNEVDQQREDSRLIRQAANVIAKGLYSPLPNGVVDQSSLKVRKWRVLKSATHPFNGTSAAVDASSPIFSCILAEKARYLNKIRIIQSHGREELTSEIPHSSSR